MRRVSISPEILPTEDLKNKKERNVGGRNFVSTVRARRFLTSSRPNFQTFCTLAVRKSLLRVVRRGKRTASRRKTPRILNPHGSQSLDPEETKGRYILPLRFPFSRHPRRCPPAQRRFLIRSRRFVHSAQRHVRRYSPLIFAIPWQKTAEGGRDVSWVSSSYPRLHARPVLSPVYSSILILTSFVLRSPWHFSPPFSSKTRFRNLNIVNILTTITLKHVLEKQRRGFDFPFRCSETYIHTREYKTRVKEGGRSLSASLSLSLFLVFKS